MRLFFIGDIVGKPGRKILADKLPEIRAEFGVDIVVANGENAAGGNGISRKMAEEIFRAGVDAITLGDHIWDQRCFESEISLIENLCRPANLPAGNPGREYVVVEREGFKLGIFNLLGQTLTKTKADCPFAAADRILASLVPECDAVFLDFHAETTSEKVSMAWHLDGRIAALVGTHTHIPTNDARLFPKGLAFMSDAGMTGPWNSCLGRNWENILKKFVDGRPRAFTMAEGDNRICGCMIEIDNISKRAVSIEPYVWPQFPNTLSALEKSLAEEESMRKAEAEKLASADINDID